MSAIVRRLEHDLSTPSPDARPPVRQRAVLALSCLALATISYTAAGLAMCMPAMAAELQLSYAQQGLVFSAVMWPFLLAVVMAAIVDRTGFRGLLLLGPAVQAAGWFSLAGAHTLSQAVGAAIVAGVGGSMAEAVVTPLVCVLYPRDRARMTNFLHGFYGLGLAGVTLLITLLHPSWLSWRWTCRMLGLLCLPYGAAAAFLALPPRTHLGTERARMRTLTALPLFWVLSAALFLGGAAEMGPSNWLPTFVRTLSSRDAAHSATMAGVGLMLFGVLMAAGRFLSSAMVRRVGVRKLLALSALLCIVCLLAAGLVPSPIGRAISLGMVGLGVACFWPTLMAVAGDTFPHAGASMFSFLAAVGGLGCAVAPAALGWLADSLGLQIAMACLSVAPAFILGVSTWLRDAGHDRAV